MKLDVITFGEVLWDIYEDPKTRGPGEPIGRVLRRELGGAPANVAVALARLGKKSGVVGGVGQDAFGDALLALLSKERVETTFLLRYPARTGLTFITRDKDGEPKFLFYRNKTADMAMRARDVTAAMGGARWVLSGTSTLVKKGLAKATFRWLEEAKARKASVAVDLNVRSHLWESKRAMKRAIAELLLHAQLVKASRDDLDALGGLTWLRKTAPGATLILTSGGGPARAIGAHGDVEARTKKAPCVDATGAGDAFLAGVLATLLTHDAAPGRAAWKSPQVFVQALRVGHMLGRKAISATGAVTGLTGLSEAKRALGR